MLNFHSAIHIFTQLQEFSAFAAPEVHCCLQKSSIIQSNDVTGLMKYDF